MTLTQQEMQDYKARRDHVFKNEWIPGPTALFYYIIVQMGHGMEVNPLLENSLPDTWQF